MAKTLINLKDDLLTEAIKATGMNKKVDVVNYALALLVRQKQIEQIASLKGTVTWEGDLAAMRSART